MTLGLCWLCTCAAGFGAEHGYTAHEWGTFTSVQGGDGRLLEWRPLQSSLLPAFIYDSHPRFNKGELLTLQRMETPVIYFHSSRNFKVDVNVRFPQGWITEWYPQASGVEKGVITWSNLSVLADCPDRPDLLPQDKSGSHYFTARAAASQWLRTDSPAKSEAEKFLFYRGAGSFQTPLRASIDAANSVVVENTGARKLSHLFLISIHDGRGSFTEVDSLASHSSQSRSVSADWPLAELQKKIAARMAEALAGEGLFADEARAMVDTWTDSWFTDEGERVLYVLPREWTDEILPLTFSPAPEKLVRVMVGRAEIITPQRVASLRQNLLKAQTGDAAARARSETDFKALGRFAEPALRLVHLQDAPASAPRS
jgi:hypothetical protein